MATSTFPGNVLAAFQRAGLVPVTAEDGRVSLGIDRTAAARVRHWRSEPFIKENINAGNAFDHEFQGSLNDVLELYHFTL
jgi:hypothetical protein